MRGRCGICGFDAATTSVNDSVVALRTFPRRWRAALTVAGDDADDVDRLVRVRPKPEVWSALEYVAHTRDTIAINGWAMAETLTKDHPVLEWPGGEDADIPASTAPDVDTALAELAANCERVAGKAERTDPGDWKRSAILRGGRDEEVDTLWFLHHCVHEGSHHLRDVEQVLTDVLRMR